MAGVRIEVVRTGRGTRATEVSSRADHGVIGTAVDVGFPMLSKTELGEKTLIAVAIRNAPPGMTWCGFELQSGDVVMYAPEAMHSAVNPIDAAFSFTAFDTEVLAGVADESQLDLHLPDRGSVQRMHRGAKTARLAQAVNDYVNHSTRRTLELQHTVIRGIAERRTPSPRRGPEPLDDAEIVTRCVALAERLARPPSVGEASEEVFASDRRVRTAFHRVYGVAPSEYFRRWQLDRVRRQLVDPHGPSTVTEAAASTGVFHFGRLARHYADQFGELPSDTLRSRGPA